MSELKYKRLFEPIKLRGRIFRNRIFSSPQDTYRLTNAGFLNDNATAFYEIKAMGGFASVCVGDVMVDSRSGHSHRFQLRGDDIKGRNSFTRTASAIKRHGAVAGVELNHAGKNSNVMAQNEGFIYGVSEEMREDGVLVRAMDDEWIEYLINCYAEAARFAKLCGFNLITLHGGHGWLLSQFMSPRENLRRDRWGGSLENRMRFPLAVIEAVRRSVGPEMPIDIRISGMEGLPGGYDIDEGIAIAKALDGKVDLINVSAGHHEDPAAGLVSHPTLFDSDGALLKYAEAVKMNVSTPVSAVGGLTDPDMLEEIIASGKADIVQMGRQTLADPDFPLKARTGNEDAINRCLRCFTCFATSMVGGIFYCATNPVIGHERDALNESPPRFKRRVLIAGGGIAGMQAALTAAERGHEVIICEKDAELGGILKCERHVPFKEKINSYIERQILRISRMSNVDIRLNTKVTKSYAKSLEADVIIAALGASPAVPPIKGIDGDNVFSAEKVYKDPLKAGKAAVIIGGGLVGVELGIFLGKLGAKVTVVEMLPETIATMKTENISKMITDPGKLNFGDNVYHGIAIREQINKLPDMKVLVSTKVVEITPDGIVVNNTDGEYMIKADSVIYAIGMKAREIEAWDLSDCAKEFYQIGDCLESSNIVNATQAAYQIARDIGRF